MGAEHAGLTHWDRGKTATSLQTTFVNSSTVSLSLAGVSSDRTTHNLAQPLHVTHSTLITTKRLTFCMRHFQIHFLEWKLCFDWNSQKFFPKGPVNDKPSLVQIMARHQTSDTPLFEPTMTLFTCAYASLDTQHTLIQPLAHDIFHSHLALMYDVLVYMSAHPLGHISKEMSLNIGRRMNKIKGA